jgi:hypothetical protein
MAQYSLRRALRDTFRADIEVPLDEKMLRNRALQLPCVVTDAEKADEP